MAVREAINKTIEELIKSGYDQKQAAAIAYEEAKKMTGKSLGREV
jgi:microsomal dipeptidase-like Zn-dependent dipeptidase